MRLEVSRLVRTLVLSALCVCSSGTVLAEKENVEVSDSYSMQLILNEADKEMQLSAPALNELPQAQQAMMDRFIKDAPSSELERFLLEHEIEGVSSTNGDIKALKDLLEGQRGALCLTCVPGEDIGIGGEDTPIYTNCYYDETTKKFVCRKPD